MSLGTEQSKFLLDVCKLILHAIALGFRVTGGELLRTKLQQEFYVKTRRSKTMLSQHLKALAIDLNFFIRLIGDEHETWVNGLVDKDQMIEILRPLGEYWESLDPKNRWGGNFDQDWSRRDPWIDAPHFERMG